MDGEMPLVSQTDPNFVELMAKHPNAKLPAAQSYTQIAVFVEDVYSQLIFLVKDLISSYIYKHYQSIPEIVL